MRSVISTTLAAMTLSGIACVAQSLPYPGKPIRMIIGFTAGSEIDVVGRLIAQEMSDQWGQRVVVDNRTGAGGTVGAAIVAAFGAALLYAALAPMAVVLRRLTPTPERLLALALALPFRAVLFLGLDLLLRRGTPGQAAAWSLAGRALMVVLWIVGVELRIVPPMTVVIGPLFLIVLLPLEVVAWRVHARSRNLVITAVFEALAFGWIATMLLPLRF